MPFAVAGLDQLAQVRVPLRLGLEIVPGRDVQGGDPGLAPARREVVQVDARAVGGIEERPQAIGAERRLQAQIGQRLQQVRESARSRARRAAPPPRGPRPRRASSRPSSARRSSARARRPARLPGMSKTGNSSPFSQMIGSVGTVHVDEALHSHRSFCARRKPNEVGQRRFAFEDQDRAALHARGPFRAGRGDPVRATKIRDTPAGWR